MSDTIDSADYTALMKKTKPSKYRNVKVEIDGITFDSKAEARRYEELKLRAIAHEIDKFGIQVRFDIIVNGVNICKYYADFAYYDRCSQRCVYEDVKGAKTAVYRLKKKLVEAQYGIEIVEITA